jgi:hypothetical protein
MPTKTATRQDAAKPKADAGDSIPSVHDHAAFDAYMEQVVKNADRRSRAERKRLISLGIVDPQGNLLKAPTSTGGSSGGFGGWG